MVLCKIKLNRFLFAFFDDIVALQQQIYPGQQAYRRYSLYTFEKSKQEPIENVTAIGAQTPLMAGITRERLCILIRR